MLWVRDLLYHHECLAGPEHKALKKKKKLLTILFVICFLYHGHKHLISESASESHSYLTNLSRLTTTPNVMTDTATDDRKQVVSEELTAHQLSNGCSQLKHGLPGRLLKCNCWNHWALPAPVSGPGVLDASCFYRSRSSKSSDAGKGDRRRIPGFSLYWEVGQLLPSTVGHMDLRPQSALPAAGRHLPSSP